MMRFDILSDKGTFKGFTPGIVKFENGDRKLLRLMAPIPNELRSECISHLDELVVHFEDTSEINYLIDILTNAKQQFINHYREQYQIMPEQDENGGC